MNAIQSSKPEKAVININGTRPIMKNNKLDVIIL